MIDFDLPLQPNVALAVSDLPLWGLIEWDADFPAVRKVRKRIWNDGQVAANDGRITPGTVFQFKCGDGRSIVRLFCLQLLLDLFAILRAGIGVQSTAADQSQTSWWNVLEPAGQKLLGGQCHQFFLAVSVISIPKRDGGVSQRVNPAVRNWPAGDVAGEIPGHRDSVGISFLDADVPGHSPEPIQRRLHACGRCRCGDHQPLLRDGRLEQMPQLSSEDRHEDSSWQQRPAFQALNALVFVFKEILQRPLGDLGEIARAQRPKHLPVVLTRDEVQRVLSELTGTHQLMAWLLYGCGLRLNECLTLRVKLRSPLDGIHSLV